jgi:hypothetical protein
MKRCTGPCKESLPVDQFSPGQGKCKACRRGHRTATGTQNGDPSLRQQSRKRRVQSILDSLPDGWVICLQCEGTREEDEYRMCASCRTGSDHPKERHGMTHTPTYISWKAMRDRCVDSTQHNWANYGGKGVRVCDRWQNSFKAFLEDMGPRPDGYTISRKDHDGNYEPSNCEWALRYTH